MTATAREAVAAVTAQAVAEAALAHARAEVALGDAAPTLAAWATAAGIGVGRLRYLRQTHAALRVLEIRGAGARPGQASTAASVRAAAARVRTPKVATKKQRKTRRADTFVP